MCHIWKEKICNQKLMSLSVQSSIKSSRVCDLHFTNSDRILHEKKEEAARLKLMPFPLWNCHVKVIIILNSIFTNIIYFGIFVFLIFVCVWQCNNIQEKVVLSAVNSWDFRACIIKYINDILGKEKKIVTCPKLLIFWGTL